MTPLSLSKIYQGYRAMQKENKRCIPKEGMPHASACQKIKETMHTQRRYATCLGMSKKEERRKDSPLSKKKEKVRDGAYKGVHTPSTKNIHTLTHLDQGL